MEHYGCTNVDLDECKVVTFLADDDGLPICPGCGAMGLPVRKR